MLTELGEFEHSIWFFTSVELNARSYNQKIIEGAF